MLQCLTASIQRCICVDPHVMASNDRFTMPDLDRERLQTCLSSITPPGVGDDQDDGLGALELADQVTCLRRLTKNPEAHPLHRTSVYGDSWARELYIAWSLNLALGLSSDTARAVFSTYSAWQTSANWTLRRVAPTARIESLSESQQQHLWPELVDTGKSAKQWGRHLNATLIHVAPSLARGHCWATQCPGLDMEQCGRPMADRLSLPWPVAEHAFRPPELRTSFQFVTYLDATLAHSLYHADIRGDGDGWLNLLIVHIGRWDASPRGAGFLHSRWTPTLRTRSR